MMQLQIRLQRMLRARGKDAFVAGLPHGARVFDIGCGNASAQRVKQLRPDLYYVDLDVQDYEQSAHALSFADEYRTTRPRDFLDAIGTERATMDAVISSHNLEHCEAPVEVLERMAGALRPAGRLYLSFPCGASVDFPRRAGSLSFFDDPTHRSPPVWQEVLSVLERCGSHIVFAAERYRPWAPATLELVLEPLSAWTRRVMPLGATWAWWGFESVVWAERLADARGSNSGRSITEKA